MTKRKPAPLEVRYVPITDLVPADKNPRRISTGARARLRSGLAGFSHLIRAGMVQPVVVQKSSHKVIGGHQRLALLRDMGEKEVPIVEVAATDEEASALAVLLNNTEAQGEFDLDVLASFLKELQTAGGSLELTGFSADRLAELMAWNPDVPMKPIDTSKPPKMSWVLIGVPTVKYGEIADQVRAIAERKDIICETTVTTDASRSRIKKG